MHSVGHVEPDFAGSPGPDTATTRGLARRVVVGPAQGAVHTELAIGSLAPGGYIARHLHSFEEALYVLGGELTLGLDAQVHRLVDGDFALMPVGTWHALGNAGSEEVRWLSLNTPQRIDASSGRRDTFFAPEAFDLETLAARAARPPFGDPSLGLVGHYAGTPPQAEALALPDPAIGRRAVGMDAALVVYSGISVKMLVDRALGADLLTMFTVDYEPNGAAQVHDHTFEETYFFLDGEIEAELDGMPYTLRAGDIVFSGVGSTHGFFNTSPGRVRWIETQAPQPPVRHVYRWVQQWERFEERTGAGPGR